MLRGVALEVRGKKAGEVRGTARAATGTARAARGTARAARGILLGTGGVVLELRGMGDSEAMGMGVRE